MKILRDVLKIQTYYFGTAACHQESIFNAFYCVFKFLVSLNYQLKTILSSNNLKILTRELKIVYS